MHFFENVGRGFLEVFKLQFEQISFRDQVFGVFEAANRFFVQVQSFFGPDFRAQVAEGVFCEHHLPQVNGGLIDGSRVTADVYELGVREHFQQRGDAIGMGRGLHDADSFAPQGHFFHQREQGIFPDAAFGFGHFRRVKESFVNAHSSLEGGHEVGGQGGPDGQCDFVFLGGGPGNFDVVHGSFSGQQPFRQWCIDFLSEQEVSRKQAFVEVEECEFGVECHEVVQHGGAAAPVPKDEDGGSANWRASDASAVDETFEAIHQAVVAGQESG